MKILVERQIGDIYDAVITAFNWNKDITQGMVLNEVILVDEPICGVNEYWRVVVDAPTIFDAFKLGVSLIEEKLDENIN